jgi:hypothetical protein
MGKIPQATYDDGIGASKYADQTNKLISDGDQKAGMSRGNEGGYSTADTLRQSPSVSFEYKNPELGEGRQVGMIAQNLEKTKAGKALVSETPIGKAIDIPKATGFALAAAADHQKEIDLLKKQVASAPMTEHGGGNTGAGVSSPMSPDETKFRHDEAARAKKDGDVAKARSIRDAYDEDMGNHITKSEVADREDGDRRVMYEAAQKTGNSKMARQLEKEHRAWAASRNKSAKDGRVEY